LLMQTIRAIEFRVHDARRSPGAENRFSRKCAEIDSLRSAQALIWAFRSHTRVTERPRSG